MLIRACLLSFILSGYLVADTNDSFLNEDYPPRFSKELQVYQFKDPKGKGAKGKLVVLKRNPGDPELTYVETRRKKTIYSSKPSLYATSEGVGSQFILSPMVGTTQYSKAQNGNLSNSYSFGLVLAKPLINGFVGEIETNWASNSLKYEGSSYGFSQWSFGGNFLFYPFDGIFQPYIGAGALAIYSQDIPALSMEDRWTGALQIMLGADVYVRRNISVGFRGVWVSPLTSHSRHTGAMIQGPGPSPFYRLMGTVSVHL